MELPKFTPVGSQSPLNGGRVYADMKDNLNNIRFDVWVTESFNPEIHPRYLEPDAPPPTYSVSSLNANDYCKSKLSIRYIISALVTGQYLEFCNPADMDLVKSWINQYLEQFRQLGTDAKLDTEVQMFNANAKKAYDMLCGNLKRRDDMEQRRNPRRLSIAALLKGL